MSKLFAIPGLKALLKPGGPGALIMIVGFWAMSFFLAANCTFAADDEGSGSGDVHQIIAELSDEQVRRLLIEELQKTRSYSEDEGTGLISKGVFSGRA